MPRYGPLTALVYDVGSGERLLYRAGRLDAIALLHLRPGQRVLVLGAGTGLDLAPVAEAIGADGGIVAVDSSAAMLRRTGARVRALRRRRAFPAVRLVLADATRARTLLPPGEGPVDAVLAVNTLSLIPDWRGAWAAAVRTARPGARVAVADIGRPAPGNITFDLWSKVISAIGGGDLDAHPWRAIEEGATGVQGRSRLRGHVAVRAGVLP